MGGHLHGDSNHIAAEDYCDSPGDLVCVHVVVRAPELESFKQTLFIYPSTCSSNSWWLVCMEQCVEWVLCVESVCGVGVWSVWRSVWRVCGVSVWDDYVEWVCGGELVCGGECVESVCGVCGVSVWSVWSECVEVSVWSEVWRWQYNLWCRF